MTLNLNSLDRRRFLRSGVALAASMFESSRAALNASGRNPKRLACFYFPDGVRCHCRRVAYKDWLWFPHGNGRKFEFTKCFEPLPSGRLHRFVWFLTPPDGLFMVTITPINS